MAQYIVNFIISVPTEGRVAQMGSCCQIYLIDAPPGVSALCTQHKPWGGMRRCPSQKSRAVKDVNCKTRIPKDPCKGSSLPAVPCNHCWEKAALAVPSLCLRTALAQGKHIQTAGCLVVSFGSTMKSNLFSSPEDLCRNIIHIS